MNKILPSLDDAAEELRRLATAAEPAIHARPGLARSILDLARSHRRTRRLGTAAASVGGGFVVLATLAAATLLGQAEYFTLTQPSTNMESTVRMGERVVFSKNLSPARGDVVVVRLVDNGHEYDSIMRVVALAGDTIGCPADATGRCEAIAVNGVTMPEDYLGTTVTDPFPTSTVPAHMIFVLGDNRPQANDSRSIGPVKLADVTGVAINIRNRDGQTRAVPGAPAHDGPGDRDNVDPAPPVPPAGVSEPR
ncbi:signal peptidase I [Micromonospora halophytica]|uniref:Signal peptidase I n=1 Tax=Micromonospora halophytica TaxID=47864 RepID=A0A1C5HP88_9ACTN|nr:signal peptidase I [Micromonospora halophytica]SCG47723.1 signal peptidase I [Micromonospora halophytica]